MIKARNGVEIPRDLREICDPRHTAMLVYDMQVGICGQVEGADKIIERVSTVLDAARSVGMRVAFTRHISLPQLWLGRTQLRTAMAWQKQDNPDSVQPWFLANAAATQITPELAPRTDEIVIDKITMSAFDSTPLALALNDTGVRCIAIAGIALEIGIEPTIRQATDNGFIGVLIKDACGSGSPEAADRSLATLSFIGETVITDSTAFCQALRPTSARSP